MIDDIDSCELRAAEQLGVAPKEAIATFRVVHELARVRGDVRRAAAALVGMGIALFAVGEPKRSRRVLWLASRYYPDWHVPLAELAMEYETLADRALARRALGEAAAGYATAATFHGRAAELVEAGADHTGTPEMAEAERAREAWCRAQVAQLQPK